MMEVFKIYGRLLLWITLLFILTTVAGLISFLAEPNNHASLGQIGDFFGGIIGTFFTVIGTVVLILTMTEQRKDLKLAKQEFEYNRVLDLVSMQVELVHNVLDKIIFNSGTIVEPKPTKDSQIQFRITANQLTLENDLTFDLIIINLDPMYHSSLPINIAFKVVNDRMKSDILTIEMQMQLRALLKEGIHMKVIGFYQVIIPRLNHWETRIHQRWANETWKPNIHLEQIQLANQNLFGVQGESNGILISITDIVP